MKKNIWIFNHYASSDYFDKGGRHYWIAKYLKQNGYNPVVFCCNTKHNDTGTYYKNDKLFQVHKAKEINVPYVFIKGRPYTGNGKQRILNMIDFYVNVKRTAEIYAKMNVKPDVIYASSVHPLTLLAGIQIARYFGVKCICEVRDLWPETIVEYSYKDLTKNWIIKMLYVGERWIYKNADAIIFTMEGGKKYICDRGWDKGRKKIDMKKIFYINNGVDLEVFDSNAMKKVVEDQELDDDTIFKVVYAGSIRRVNNLGVILKAAKKLEDTNVKFLIWGDGNELEDLKKTVKQLRIRNVVFKGKVDKQYIPSILKRADVNLVHWKMSPILRYGASYNKLFEYMAAGKPIFSTVTPAYSIIRKYECGVEADEFTEDSISDGIRKMLNLQFNEREEMGRNARKGSVDFDFKYLTQKFEGILSEL